MKKLIVATSNPGKLRELQKYLQGEEWELALKPEELDIEETGTTFAENAALKASQVAQALGEWAIADDSGLAVDALDGAPGVYSARYGQTDSERIERLLNALENNPQRKAQFICAIALARPNGAIALTVEASCAGEIALTARGENGFGYDPIFYVPALGLTFAEMSPETKQSISHRGKAIQLFLQKLGDSGIRNR
ncbi:RdgB/HAM1 family non-canonical purine NTP pyrophosphatase [Spirulina subsalsa]|uniref:RdgB/HAM1 family non-canonical purine NTP pyrophosphatase n=1 Tax=Spirulina subsalsa TaxID=54311 RepID=UPI0002D4F0E0|nr:RdgB/HAM1 family non-canonical purine NTP pyrophosphatase [Spirulina subsalsa]